MAQQKPRHSASSRNSVILSEAKDLKATRHEILRFAQDDAVPQCWLPTTVKEAKARGWDELDVVLFSGDAYVDHPSFGTAVVGRILEAEGYRVAIVPQPNWRDDLRDFTKFGAPRLFFGVSAGAMDSMVNHYTANKRLRSDDAYTAGGLAGRRPDRAVTVYTRILKRLFPHVPVVAGGIEASLRRLAHYDYWDDTLHPSLLVDSGADVIAYGMGERVMPAIARALENGFNAHLLHRIPQIAYLSGVIPGGAKPISTPSVEGEGDGHVRGGFRPPDARVGDTAAAGEASRLTLDTTPSRSVILSEARDLEAASLRASQTRSNPATLKRRHSERSEESQNENIILLNSFEECQTDPRKFAENFVKIEQSTNPLHQTQTLVEPTAGKFVVVNPPYPRATEAETDRAFDLPFTRLPHPRYRDKAIPAFDMIKFSVNIHRGCFGACSFCTIAAHQGKFVTTRSERSILKELEQVAQMPGFAGNISDLGAPSANMYGMRGRDESLCARCMRPSCAFPKLCRNLDNSHARLLALYRRAGAVQGIRRIFIGSGIRYDLFGADAAEYLREVIVKHTSGRLKVAPEHTEPHVLRLMRKQPFELFERLNDDFLRICKAEGLRYQLIPYFISSHPGCTEDDMRRLSQKTRHLHTEQVQDLTPTPMTLSSVMFWTGLDPYALQRHCEPLAAKQSSAAAQRHSEREHERARGTCEGGEPIPADARLYVARSPEAKRRQKSWFFK